MAANIFSIIPHPSIYCIPAILEFIFQSGRQTNKQSNTQVPKGTGAVEKNKARDGYKEGTSEGGWLALRHKRQGEPPAGQHTHRVAEGQPSEGEQPGRG